jgi:carbon-monoxide dehydrogenase large subunit
MSGDRSSGLIGTAFPRPGARRAVAARGVYTDDIAPAHTAHVAFLRSPHAHARIVTIDLEAARASAGVVAAFSGADLTAICKPFVTRLERLPSHRSAPQYPLAVDEACWQGEAVAAVVAESRAEAEDALDHIRVEWRELPAVASIEEGMAANAPPVHSALDANLSLDHTIASGDAAAAFAAADVVVAHRFEFGRQTGVSLEPRSILARYDRATGELTVHQSHQVPFQMREVFAAQLGLRADDVRVIAPDVGGAFGLKLHAYADEMAAVAIAVLVDRPIKFVADRLESFISDAHAREAVVEGRMAFDRRGRILALDVDIIAGFGAYSCHPRSSVGEALHAAQVAGAPYEVGAFHARVRGVYQNKPPSGAYRGVGQPIACAITEQLVELGAARLGMDAAEIRELNFRRAKPEPTKTQGGIVIETLSLHECLETLKERMDYPGLRRAQAVLRQKGIWRGVGLAAFVEMTGVGPGLYGPLGLRISAHEACRVSLQETGVVRCETSVTDQGQGTLTGLIQIVADELGVPASSVQIVAGDTARVPYGGGAWASRGLALGGEAALRASRKLRDHILGIAGALLQTEPTNLRLTDGAVVNASGHAQLTMAALAATARFRPDTIPMSDIPSLEVVEHYAPTNLPYLSTNGVLAAHVEVDAGTGLVRVLKFWVVDDCGRVINPLLVDEQIRGGVVQGIGATLYEHCCYSADGQFTNGSLADYPLPLASEMPDIDVAHVATPTRETLLGARGVGEAGIIGAIGAMWTAVNDALSPFGAAVQQQPFTPERILDAIEAGGALRTR